MRFQRNLLATLVAGTAAVSMATERPNIVLIYTDDLGFGDVSVNGAAPGLTPNIDRLAAEGINFTDAHCPAATCTPSRFALLTGKYAFRQKGTGIARGDANMIIRPGTPTIASMLKGVGYRTGVVGKWHLGLGEGKVDWNAEITPGPESIGFDYHFLIPATGDRTPCVYVEQGRVVDLDPADPIAVSYGDRIDSSPSGKDRPDLLKMKWSHGHDQTIVNGISRIGWMTGGEKARWIDEDMADVITSKAVGFIERNKNEKFFLYFSTHDVHVPRVPHSRFAGKSGMGPRGDAIVQMDWCVGEVLRALEENGLTDDTLVIFTSDNGPVLDDGYVDDANEKLGDHDPAGEFRGGKYSKFEAGTRVPTIVRWPGFVDAGKTSDVLLGQIDFASTLAALVGAEGGGFVDSRNQLAAFLGKPSMGREHLVHQGSGGLALRFGKWKYVRPGNARDGLGPWREAMIEEPGALYDLSVDIAEKNDVSAEHPELVKKLSDLLQLIESRGHDRV